MHINMMILAPYISHGFCNTKYKVKMKIDKNIPTIRNGC
jgi:hypothetical protein